MSFQYVIAQTGIEGLKKGNNRNDFCQLFLLSDFLGMLVCNVRFEV